MGTPIVVDCEAPFGVGAPSVGDMTEFGAVDVNALQDGRVETFHGVGRSAPEDTFRQFRRMADSAVAGVRDRFCRSRSASFACDERRNHLLPCGSERGIEH